MTYPTPCRQGWLPQHVIIRGCFLCLVGVDGDFTFAILFWTRSVVFSHCRKSGNCFSGFIYRSEHYNPQHWRNLLSHLANLLCGAEGGAQGPLRAHLWDSWYCHPSSSWSQSAATILPDWSNSGERREKPAVGSQCPCFTVVDSSGGPFLPIGHFYGTLGE